MIKVVAWNLDFLKTYMAVIDADFHADSHGIM
jgi:hypothetical protein